MNRSFRAVCTGALAALALGLAGTVQADPVQIYSLSARTDYLWMSTSDTGIGENWLKGLAGSGPGVVDATHPYGNPATSALAPEDMMWHCPSGGCSGSPRTNLVYFSTVFTLNSDFKVSGGRLDIIADDYFELYLNGILISSGLLEANMDSSGQPVPLSIDLARYKDDFYGGDNLLAIKAMDGNLRAPGDSCTGSTVQTQAGPFCQRERGYEYVYVAGSVETIPEPPVGSLTAFSIAALAAVRQRRRSR